MEVITVADTVVVHLDSWDRGNETNTTTRYVKDTAGTIVRREGRTGDDSDAVERFVLTSGMARWRTPVDSGTASVDGPAFYWPRASNNHDVARLAAFLLARPQRTVDLLPFHSPASAEVVADTAVCRADRRSGAAAGPASSDGPVARKSQTTGGRVP